MPATDASDIITQKHPGNIYKNTYRVYLFI